MGRVADHGKVRPDPSPHAWVALNMDVRLLRLGWVASHRRCNSGRGVGSFEKPRLKKGTYARACTSIAH
jgi:hypothetical protein